MNETLDESELRSRIRSYLAAAERALDGGYRYTARGYMDDALTHANELIERRQRESGG